MGVSIYIHGPTFNSPITNSIKGHGYINKRHGCINEHTRVSMQHISISIEHMGASNLKPTFNSPITNWVDGARNEAMMRVRSDAAMPGNRSRSG